MEEPAGPWLASRRSVHFASLKGCQAAQAQATYDRDKGVHFHDLETSSRLFGEAGRDSDASIVFLEMPVQISGNEYVSASGVRGATLMLWVMLRSDTLAR